MTDSHPVRKHDLAPATYSPIYGRWARYPGMSSGSSPHPPRMTVAPAAFADIAIGPVSSASAATPTVNPRPRARMAPPLSCDLPHFAENAQDVKSETSDTSDEMSISFLLTHRATVERAVASLVVGPR